MKILLTISYDGANYFGWQRQKNVITVQQIVEEKLSLLLKKDIKLLESVMASYFAERNNTSWISRYVKFFFLAPIKFYYAMEKRIVYRMEAFLVRNGLMKI